MVGGRPPGKRPGGGPGAGRPGTPGKRPGRSGRHASGLAPPICGFTPAPGLEDTSEALAHPQKPSKRTARLRPAMSRPGLDSGPFLRSTPNDQVNALPPLCSLLRWTRPTSVLRAALLPSGRRPYRHVTRAGVGPCVERYSVMSTRRGALRSVLAGHERPRAGRGRSLRASDGLAWQLLETEL